MAFEVSEGAIGRNDQAGYRNSTTPESAVALLRVLEAGRGLSPEIRAVLLRLMSTSSTRANRIQGLLPQGTPVAHKIGSSGTAQGVTRGTNDIGIVTLPNGMHLAIVAFVDGFPRRRSSERYPFLYGSAPLGVRSGLPGYVRDAGAC
jgi:beta-lactamase class A